ncbi:anti-sigma factor [Marivita sp. GX14005]|uniref:anti-sigma factor n=1 Tax=Marivita sp. GX14005 TaxID=2942276 RepID=UPI002018AADB|nr:anti-sigma factor [Marivita sp. GX14005]MCL3883024.1 anti-sigma factor [Marivita sp. GX14005]
MSRKPPSNPPPGGAPSADAAEYALGLMTENERAEFEARLVEDADLRAELAAWQTALADLAESEVAPAAPSPQLRKRLEAQLFAAPRASLWQSLWPYAAGGVAAALVLWAAVASDLLLPDTPLRPDLRSELAATPEGGNLSVLAAVDSATGRLEIVRLDGAPPEGRVFELWLIVGDSAPVSLGVLEGDTALLDLPETRRADLAGATLAISDEPPGGSPTGAPTGSVRAAGTLTAS